ncbi:MAG: hypothetical protein M1839_002588 [Geoglossum umbratile]|nr:MAG: hypothetical protein M1839_002588 [Geoglossum umbratile]
MSAKIEEQQSRATEPALPTQPVPQPLAERDENAPDHRANEQNGMAIVGTPTPGDLAVKEPNEQQSLHASDGAPQDLIRLGTRQTRKPLKSGQLQALRARAAVAAAITPAPSVTYWYCDCVKNQKNYGGEATFSVYRPRVEVGDHSLLEVSVANNEMGFMQTVEAGWRRDPTDGDGEVKFFIFYATHGYEDANLGPYKGGYNMDVAGWTPVVGPFPQPHDNLQYSHIGGDQKEVRIKWQLVGDAWYLRVDGNWIGWYDASLFSNGQPDKTKTLADHANQIHFYGEVADSVNPNPQQSTTDMGSGNFPKTGWKKSAYIRNMTYQPKPSNLSSKMLPFDGFASRNPVNFDPLRYDMQEHMPSGVPNWGSSVYLGGPGRKSFDWLNWDTIGNGNKVDQAVFPQGGPISAVARRPDVIDLFMVANNKKVYTSWWTGSGGWSGFDDSWEAIGGGDFPPTAKVAAVARQREIIDLFCVGNDGKVYTNWWTKDGGWAFTAGWQSIGGSFPKEAEVTAVARSKDNLDLFICGGNGQVYTAFWADGGPNWPGPNDSWFPISLFDSFPAANKVSAVARSKDHLDLFICSTDGQVHWATWSSTSPWSGFTGAFTKLGGGVSPGTFPANATVAAVSRREDVIDLFVCGADGRVYTSWYTSGGGWLTPANPWKKIGGRNEFSPGYPLVALARQPEILDLFVCGTDGHVYTSWWAGADPWSGEGDNWRDLEGRFQGGVAARIAAVARTQANIDIVGSNFNGRINQTAWGG